MFHFAVRRLTLNPDAMVSGRCRVRVGYFSAMIMVCAVLGVLFFHANVGCSSPSMPEGTSVLEKAPGFVLKDLEGKIFRLGDYKGKKPVLLIFSATWCGYCREEIPRFKAIHATYANRGLEIVNIDVQESKERVARFAAKYELPYRVLLDDNGVVGGIYDLPGVPVMVLVDKDGNIACRMCQRVEPLIESLLKKN